MLASKRKDLLSVSNIVLIITGIYFALVASLQQGSSYALVGTVLCFVAVGFVLAEGWFFVGPWRIATEGFCLAVLITQLVANASTPQGATGVIVVSTLVNGAFLVLLLGVLLATTRDMLSGEKESEEGEELEQEKEKRETKKKLTYEI